MVHPERDSRGDTMNSESVNRSTDGDSDTVRARVLAPPRWPTTHKFQTLYEQMCDILRQPPVQLHTGGEGPTAFHLDRHGVSVDVLHFPATCPDHAHVLIEFGAVAHDDPHASRILLVLLDTNFLFPQAHPPAFGRNPVTGVVVLRCVYPLGDSDAPGLLQLIDEGASLAREWRHDQFLKDAPPMSDQAQVGGGPMSGEIFA
jgi:hypothetical protein